MKNLYKITSKNGAHLCYQVGSTEKDAIESARMHGFRGARRAKFIRED